MNTVDDQHGGTARPPMMQTALPEKPAPKTSGTAIASVICGALGACTLITSVIGVILGIVALNQIKNSNGEKRGQGLAIAGIVLSCVTLIIFLFGLLMAGIMLPALGKAQQRARALKMQAEARITYVDFGMYAAENEAYPPADDWHNALNQMYEADGNSAWIPDYLAMNSALSDVRPDEITDPATTVLLFERSEEDDIAGGRELLTTSPRQYEGVLIILADGTAEFFTFDEIDTLSWEP